MTPNDPETMPNIKVKWIFSQMNEADKEEDAAERFSTIAMYDATQCRSIIRLPCPVEEAEALILPLEELDE
ncbi:hypothetical protein KIPB_003513 [Kipferlia bialata]|uniref:Uncharacterized protein n=1 Tax=Kipferlia bialata TaxID=797122 RepID=A0A9K3CTK0_9EUKA|nr:hypothetical protein KIPB_003513 [Kipferlia bialata]|eukprot:g3513.t1